MYKKVSLGIITILATAAILTVLSSELQLSYAQTNQDLERKILDVHNSERDCRWSCAAHVEQQSRAGAQTWAQHLATTGQFAHDPVHTGLSCTGPATVRTLQAFSTMYPNQTGDSLNGSPKSLFITAARLFMPLVITLRWSGRRRNRSVVRPTAQWPAPVVIHSAFWCVATILRATMRISCRILQQVHQAKP